MGLPRSKRARSNGSIQIANRRALQLQREHYRAHPAALQIVLDVDAAIAGCGFGHGVAVVCSAGPETTRPVAVETQPVTTRRGFIGSGFEMFEPDRPTRGLTRSPQCESRRSHPRGATPCMLEPRPPVRSVWSLSGSKGLKRPEYAGLAGAVRPLMPMCGCRGDNAGWSAEAQFALVGRFRFAPRSAVTPH